MAKKNIVSTKKVSKAPQKAKAPQKVVAKKSVKAPAKKIIAEKSVKAPAKKIIAEKSAVKISPVKKSVPVKKTVSSKRSVKPVVQESRGVLRQTFVREPKIKRGPELTPFFEKQRVRLLLLKDTLLDSMKGVARDNLHAGSDASAFGMHQADAGSDAYDRDFALSILSQEQNSLYEIDEALRRIDDGTYGVCEISNKPISRARLEARPFTRYTVECQAELEKRQHFSGVRLAVSSLFGLTEEETENEDDDNIIENTKD
ncbi:MAG: TraR/DksA C4-type zinc finger protein [Chthoniobacterales bacterium]